MLQCLVNTVKTTLKSNATVHLDEQKENPPFANVEKVAAK